VNPFIRLVEDPVTASAIGAYALVLVAALLATWYVLTRNVMTLYVSWDSGAWKMPPGPWAARAIAVPVILAVDLLLFGALIWLVTGG
jgi:hypothetical protein